jgi:hypothetical protein
MENTFDLKKFLIENELTTNSNLLKEEVGEMTPQQATTAATKVVSKIENNSTINNIAAKIEQDPKALEQLKAVLTKSGVDPNKLSENIDSSMISKLALTMAQKSENLEEENVGGGFWVGLIGGGALANYLAGLNDVVYSAQEIILGASNPSHMAATLGGAIAGAVLGVIAAKIFSSEN